MTATAGPRAAETYLRLMAEAELRRSLSCPRYPLPEQRRRPPMRVMAAVLTPPASRLARAVRVVWPARPRPGLPAWVTRSAAAQAVSTGLSGMSQRAAPAAAAARPAAQAAWSQLAWMARQVHWRSRRAHAGLLHRLPGRLPGRPAHYEQQALMGVHHVRQAASALVTAEAISETAGRAVLAELTGALAARAKIDAGQVPEFTPGGWPHSGPVPALPARPVRAVPVAVAVPLGPDGSLGPAQVLTLVLAPDQATLTAVAHVTGAAVSRPRPGRPWHSPAHGLSDRLTVTDSQGTHCLVTPSSGHGDGHTWSMSFGLHPLPAPGAGWLDFTVAPGAPPVRVDLPGRGAGQPAPRPALVRGGLESGGLRPSAARPAERPLDELAERLLTHVGRGGSPSPDLLSALPGIAGALEAAGVLAPGSAALGRLATVADQLGVPFPAGLRPLAGPASLPGAWLSVLDRLGRADGPVRDAPVAAVLPEVDGAQFALAGLRSAAGSATVQAVAWGWVPHHQALGGERYSWWARDDAGRWQLAAYGSYGCGAGQADVELQFVPPLHPSARSLDIFLVGPASQATVTVPLDWAATG